MKPKKLVLSALAFLLVLLLACSRQSPVADQGAQEGPYKIAFLSQGTTNSYAAQVDAIAEETATENPDIGDLLYFDSAGDATKQVGQMETALSQNPDAIVLIPMSKAALTRPVQRAEQQGIPVVLCASGVNTQNYTSLVAPDTYNASLPLARWLVEDQLKGKGNIIIVDGIPGVDTSEQLGKAIRDVLKDNPGVEVVGQGYGNFSISESKALTQNFIESEDKIDGAWGSGGEAAIGIVSAFADAGGTVPPVAGGAAANGLLRLAVENNVEVGVFQFPATLSKVCLDTAVDALNGEEVQKFVNVSELPGNESFYTQELDRYYEPKFTDDYYVGTDKVLETQELASLNLIRGQ
jgi:ribose transport system substrate-binding protein